MRAEASAVNYFFLRRHSQQKPSFRSETLPRNKTFALIVLGLHFFVDAAQISTISLEISILWRIIIFPQHFFLSIAFCPQLELCLIGKVKNLSLIHLYLFIAARCSFASFLFCFHYDSIVTAFFYSQLAAVASIPFMLSNSSSFFPLSSLFI